MPKTTSMQKILSGQTLSRPSHLEIAATLIPGFVRLLFNSSLRHFGLPAYYFDLFFLSIGVSVIGLELLRRKKHHPMTPWFWPLWALVIQGCWWLAQSFMQVIPLITNWVNPLIIRFLLLFLVTLGCLISIYTIWRVQKKHPKASRVLLVSAILIVSVLIIVLYSDGVQERDNCYGGEARIDHLSCALERFLGPAGYLLFTFFVLLIPLTLAIANRAKYGAAAGLSLLPSVVIWRDLIYLPLQYYGGTWIEPAWSAGCRTSVTLPDNLLVILNLIVPWKWSIESMEACSTLIVGIEMITLLPILIFMLLLPLGLLTCRSAKTQMQWLVGGSLIGILVLCYLTMRTMVLSKELLGTSPLDLVMIGVMGLILWLPFLFFFTFTKKEQY